MNQPLWPPRKVAHGSSVPQAVALCLHCHDGSKATTPVLNWTNDYLAKILDRVTTSDDKLRMPPDRPLDNREIEQLVEFVKGR